MLARLQQLITFSLLAASLSWLAWFYSSVPWLAVSGCLLILLGYIGFLGIEFLLLRHINKTDLAPLATWTEIFKAWLGETLVAPRIFAGVSRFVPASSLTIWHLTTSSKGNAAWSLFMGFSAIGVSGTHGSNACEGSGHAFVALSLEPVFGSIDDYTPQIEAAVQQITLATSLPPLLVCHSMGGLAARAWLQTMRADTKVHHIVTIGSPHQGTWLARFSHSLNGQQMRLASSWQAQLDIGMPLGRRALFTCWYSSSDNIVFPTSSATLPGADNRLIRGKAHVQMAFAPQLIDATLGLLPIAGKQPRQ